MILRAKAALTLCAAAFFATSANADELDDLKAEGGQLIMQLAGNLQAELMGAMQAGGPVQAVNVCNLEAQDITFDVANGSDGWDISRTSHRLRNPANAPDEYETAALDDFLDRAAAGESPQTLVRAEILEQDGQRVFRMVRAIPTAEGCLACHGDDEVSAEVESILSDLYPEDLARGFSAGDIRGAFTISKVLN